VLRLEQAILIVSVCALSWLLMTAVHEFGHVVGAWLTGGRVERVVLRPLEISRTDVRPNPRPLFVAWCGPVVGVAAPLVLLITFGRLNRPPRDFVSFFTGACLIANGLYLGLGSFDRVGDAGDLLRHGAGAWQLWLFGAVTVPFGLTLWNGTGPAFGFGAARGRVSRRAALVSTCLAAVIAGMELWLAN
jgi:hypothetical protein